MTKAEDLLSEETKTKYSTIDPKDDPEFNPQNSYWALPPPQEVPAWQFSTDEIEKAERVRNHFMEQYYGKDGELYYEKDIELIQKDDWWTIRFIKWNKGNEEKALKQMVKAFEWRKAFGIWDRELHNLPREFAKAAALFPLGYDYKGRHVIYVRVKVYRKIQALNLYFQQFITGIVNHIDLMSGPRGFVIVFDVTGMGYVNIDFDFLSFLVQLLQQYYPYGLRYAVLHNVPRLLRPLWSMAKLFLGNAEKTFRFVSNDEIKKYIPSVYLPRYLGGECDLDFTSFEEAKNCPSVEELAPLHGFSDAEVERLYKIFEPHLKEAEFLAKGGKNRKKVESES